MQRGFKAACGMCWFKLNPWTGSKRFSHWWSRCSGHQAIRYPWPTLEFLFYCFCGVFVIPWPFLGSGGVLKWSWAIGLRPVLIWAPTEPYGPISDQISYLFGRKNLRSEKSKLFLKCKSPHLAILIDIRHIWEDRSRKVNNDEPEMRFVLGNFWPVISQAVQKPCPTGGVRVSP